MTAVTPIFDALAGLLEYPRADHRERLGEALDAAAAHPAAAEDLRAFAAATAEHSETQMEELFAQTFDINPVCSLEVGWQLYGDNYDRGEFMVKMRQRLRALGVEESAELPDHLIHVLPLLARLEKPVAAEFAAQYVAPAVDKMLAGIEGKQNPYERVVRAVRRTLDDLISSVQE